MKTVLREGFCMSCDVAIDPLRKNSDFQIFTLVEIYRNCSVERGVAIRLIYAFQGVLKNLHSSLVEFLEEQNLK